MTLLEEFYAVYSTNVDIRSIIGRVGADWSEMSAEDHVLFQQYFEAFAYRRRRKIEIMARENSIQLVYQNALMLYQFIRPPLRELDYTNGASVFTRLSVVNAANLPHIRWIAALTLQLVSIIMSANSTFSPIIEDQNVKTFERNFRKPQKLPGLANYIIRLVQVLLHMIYATCIVYLLRVLQYCAHTCRYKKIIFW